MGRVSDLVPSRHPYPILTINKIKTKNNPQNPSANSVGKPSGNANEEMRGAIAVLRHFVGRQPPCLAARSSSIGDDLIVSSAAASASYSTPILAAVGASPLFASAFAQFFSNQNRNFSSPPSSGLSLTMYMLSTIYVGFPMDRWCGTVFIFYLS